MLKILRKRKVAKRIFYFLAIIIIPAFVLWGSSSAIRNKENRGYAGKIFGKNISYEKYTEALYAWRNQLKMKYGDKFKQLEKLFDPNNSTWDRLILGHETKRRRIKVSDKELSQYITSLPMLQKDGSFDNQLYELFLRYSIGTQPRIFEKQMRQTVKFQKLFYQVTQDIDVSENEIKKAFIQETKQIKVKYISVLLKELKSKVRLSEEELKSHYEDKSEEFLIPIQVNLNYLGFKYPKGTDEQQKETIEKKAKKLKEFLTGDNDFFGAQSEFSVKVKETGFFSLGEQVSGFDWLPENFQDLFNLKEGEISSIFNTPRGPYIFTLKEKRIDYLPTFKEVKQKIKDKLTQQKSIKLAKEKIDNLHKQIKDQKQSNPDLGTTQIAKRLRLKVRETPFFNQYSSIPDIGLSLEFNELAFQLKSDEISEIINAQGNHYIILEVSDQKPIIEEEFQKVREDLEEILLEEKKHKAFEEFFAKLKTQANLTDLIAMNQEKEQASQTQ